MVVETLTEEFAQLLRDAAEVYTGDELALRAYALKFLQNGGVQQGFPGLCYFSETEAVFERHAHELNSFLATLMDDNDDFAPKKAIKGWQWDDPLAMKPYNRNLLVWQAFDKFLRVFISTGGTI